MDTYVADTHALELKKSTAPPQKRNARTQRGRKGRKGNMEIRIKEKGNIGLRMSDVGLKEKR